MEHVVLVIHLILAFAMIVLILLQRSDGGGAWPWCWRRRVGHLASAQSTANALTKATTFVAVGFLPRVLFWLFLFPVPSSGSILMLLQTNLLPAVV